MKRIISVTLVVAMLLSLMSGTVLAADPDTLVVTGNDATVKPGEAATITLTMEQNPGVQGISFYPIISDANGKRVTWNWTAKKAPGGADFDLNVGTIILLTADENVYSTGDLLTVTFTLPENVQSGGYTVAFVLYNGECFNDNYDEVPVVLPTVKVTVATCMHNSTVNQDGKAPTCTADGYTAGVYCEDCQTYISGHEVIPALDHEDRTNDHICDNGCGNVVTECSDKTGDGNHDCDICGKPHVSGHTYGNASCDAPATCTECGVTTGTALGHSFTKYQANNDATCMEDGTETAKCNRCDATDTRTIPGSTVGHKDDNKDCWCDYGCGTEIPIGADTLVISANNATIQPGETATIALTIVQNPGIQGMLFWPVITAPDGAKVNWTWKASNKNSDIEFDLNSGKTIVLSADGNVYDTGLLLEITFTVPADQSIGQYTLAFVVDPDDGCLDENFDAVPCIMPTVIIAVCADHNKDHRCDDCGAWMGEHSDADKDHKCDYGCQERIGICEDADKDHNCDYGCAEPVGVHEDKNKDHNCDYGCKELIGICKDADKDHNCDYGCEKYFGEHIDANKDHNCDYGCKELIGTCEDADKDHDCDYGCEKYYGVHEDKNLDHNCDYGCKDLIGTCEDADKDHDCDYGCEKYYGVHEDKNLDHNCDYGCAETLGVHADAADDGDHVCDYGCGAVLEECSDVTGDGNHNCDVCGKADVTEHDFKPADCLNLATCKECALTQGELGPHNYAAVINIAPEATRTGVLNGQCVVCGQKVVVTLPKLNTTDYSYEVITEPTMYADGIGRYTWNDTTYGSFSFDAVIRHEIPETDAQIVIESTSAMAGNTIRLEMTLKNNPGIAGILAYLKYDTSVLTLVKVENGTIFPTLDYAKALVWTADENCMGDGLLCVLEFQITEDAPAGTYPIQLIFDEVLNEEFEEVVLHTVYGAVTVFNVIYGDSSGDGKLTLKDALLLRQYFANKDPETGESSVMLEPGADANGDGKLTLKDALLLRQYFANKDPETGESTVVLGPQ